jgi:hypothetical protein
MKLLDRLRGRQEPLRAVVVALKTGGALKGLLTARDGTALVLRSGTLGNIDRNGKIAWQPLAGDVIIPMENVDYYQQGAGIDPSLIS